MALPTLAIRLENISFLVVTCRSGASSVYFEPVLCTPRVNDIGLTEIKHIVKYNEQIVYLSTRYYSHCNGCSSIYLSLDCVFIVQVFHL